jgi:hypothetical protein
VLFLVQICAKYKGCKTHFVTTVKSDYRTLAKAATSRPRGETVDRLLVHSFFCRDDNSRLTAGKNETKTYKRQKTQIRYLSHTVSTLYQKILSENPALKFGKSTFFKLRPFFVMKPTLSDRNQCLCSQCCNLQVSQVFIYFLNIYFGTHCLFSIHFSC